MFSLDDLRISFPHAEIERVPISQSPSPPTSPPLSPTNLPPLPGLDLLYVVLLPILFLTAFNSIARAPSHTHHVTLLGLSISLALTVVLTDLIKNSVGRPRPDLLARCLPLPTAPHNTLVTIDVCTQTNHHRLHDGWRSFPSGHSSFSFAGLGYVSLFLAGQMRVFAHGPNINTAGEHTEKLVRGDLVRSLVCLGPLLGALMIAISRCQDYRHDVYDVCVGSLLGWTVTYWSYRRYWPRLSSGRCDEPYSGPPAVDEVGLPRYGRVRDEEEGRQNVGYELDELGSLRT